MSDMRFASSVKRHLAPALVLALSLSSSLSLSLFSRAAFAEDASSDAEQRRTQLFREGRSLGDSGKWSEAAAKFREVVQIRSAPKALIALAIAEEHLNHLAEAKRLYIKARLDARQGDLKDDEDSAVAALRQLEPRVPGVALRMPPDVRGASVTVDGKAVDVVGGEVDLDPGPRQLAVTAPGRQPFQVTVTAVEGKRTEVDVLLPPGDASSGPGDKPGSSGGGLGAPPLGTLIVGGLGIGIGVAGIALLAVGKQAERDVKDACGGITNCPISLKPDADAAATKIIAGDLLLGVGGVALIGSGVWWFMARKKPADDNKAAANALIMPIRGGAWASFETRF